MYNGYRQHAARGTWAHSSSNTAEVFAAKISLVVDLSIQRIIKAPVIMKSSSSTISKLAYAGN